MGRFASLGILTLNLTVIAAASLAATMSVADSSAFDPQPWQADLAQTREAFATKYANFEWAVFEREADLPALFAETRTRIESAASAADAQAAFDRLARRLGDGHVRFRWPNPGAPAHTVPVQADCKALGYDPNMQGAPLATLLPGFTALGGASVFPAGVAQVAGHKLGILKIGVFAPQGYPELCEAALAALAIEPGSSCDDACSDRIEAWGAAQMTRDLIARLRAIRASDAEGLLVDLAGNGGGTEWEEAAVRMMTPQRLSSHSVGFVRGPHWAKEFRETEVELRAAARRAPRADRKFLLGLADQVAGREREANTLCDSAPLWRGEHTACSWLGRGFYGSGLIESADPATLRGKPWASLVFTPMQFPYEVGVWNRPLIVLIDAGTGSAAEEFAAALQDNHAAVLPGAPTAGAGCGHTNGGTPTTLKNSAAVLELPDCVRFRADGSNEVMGVQPDVLVGLRREDGAHRRASLLQAKLAEAIARATGRAD